MSKSNAGKPPPLTASGLGASPLDPGNDSIEASLEDFISQANKSFQEPIDGWTLNTDEVELVDEEDLAPVKPAKIAAAAVAMRAAAPRRADGKSSASPIAELSAAKAKRNGASAAGDRLRSVPARTAAEAASPIEAAVSASEESNATPGAVTAAAGGAAMAVAAPPAEPVAEVKPVPVAAAAPGPASAPAPAAPAAAPLSVAAAPVASRPMVLFGTTFAAFVLGAIVVYVLIRVMGPAQPTVLVQSPPVQNVGVAAGAGAPPVGTVAPATAAGSPAAAAPATPTTAVVTPIAQPIVTPLPTAEGKAPATEAKLPAAPSAPAAEAKAPDQASAPAATGAPREAKAPAEAKPEKKHVVARPAAHHPAKSEPRAEAPKHTAAAVKEHPAPAAKPAKPAGPAKEKGGDWVDPFAQ